MFTPALAAAVVFAASANRPLPAPADGPPGAMVKEVVEKISSERLHGIVEHLAAFGTRHTLSDTTSATRGIGAARNWIKAEMESYSKDTGGRLRVSFEEFEQPPMKRVPKALKLVNVVGVLPGSIPEAAGRRYYVVGHYDSRCTDVMDAEHDAPGANDDASGTAVVMELARVLGDVKLDSTVVFLAVAGEEQGLLGSAYHAAQAAARKEDIRGVLSNDIVGDPTGPADALGRPVSARYKIRVFSEGVPRNPTAQQLAEIHNLAGEGDSPSRELARFVAETGELERTGVRAMPVFRPDRFLRGGDHSSFNDNGYPAVRFTTVYENYDRQHQDIRTRNGRPYADLPEFVDADYLADVARLNAATIIHLANAPSSPPRARLLASELSDDTTVRWDASPEPDVAGYEVVWRDTTSATWTGCKDVGKVTEATIPLSKDNVFFGVRAYDVDGYRSPVEFPGVGRN
jgi:Zn-dependent M28 family amino/carboxypeptidase